jgi:hypothetical protein
VLHASGFFDSGPKVLMTKKLKKFTAGTQIYIFVSKIAIYLSLGLHKERPSYKRSLNSALKREHPALQDMKFLNFFMGHFCSVGSGAGSESTDLTEYGSKPLVFPPLFCGWKGFYTE